MPQLHCLWADRKWFLILKQKLYQRWHAWFILRFLWHAQRFIINVLDYKGDWFMENVHDHAKTLTSVRQIIFTRLYFKMSPLHLIQMRQLIYSIYSVTWITHPLNSQKKLFGHYHDKGYSVKIHDDMWRVSSDEILVHRMGIFFSGLWFCSLARGVVMMMFVMFKGGCARLNQLLISPLLVQ